MSVILVVDLLDVKLLGRYLLIVRHQETYSGRSEEHDADVRRSVPPDRARRPRRRAQSRRGASGRAGASPAIRAPPGRSWAGRDRATARIRPAGRDPRLTRTPTEWGLRCLTYSPEQSPTQSRRST